MPGPASIEQRVSETVQRHLGPNGSLEAARNYSPLSLDGSVAVITGASDGIGRGVTELFAIHGADLLIHGRNMGRLEEVADIARGMGSRVEIVAGEIANPETAAAIQKTLIEKFTDDKVHVDILVNNAGGTRDRKMGSLRFNDWRQVVGDHLDGAFLTADAIWLPLSASPHARIINIGSISGLTGNEGQANYSAAMAGLIGLTKTWATELAPTGGTANLLAFGPVDTKIWASLARGAKMQENAARKARGENPVGDDFDGLAPVKARMLGDRFLTVPEAASKALMLASSMGDGITAQAILIDAGISLLKLT